MAKTYGELYRPAMEITEQAEADAYFERLVEHHMEEYDMPREKAESVNRANLGYFAGYYDHETRLRVERLFNCRHPIFGPASEGQPTPEEAFAMGQKYMAEKRGQDDQD